MLRPIDNWYLQQEQPARACVEFLRSHILNFSAGITESWQYSMPFFHYNGKRFCYIWIHKERRLPYIGIVDGKFIDHPQLLAEKRSRMKIFLLDPAADIPVETIDEIIGLALQRVKSKM